MDAVGFESEFEYEVHSGGGNIQRLVVARIRGLEEFKRKQDMKDMQDRLNRKALEIIMRKLKRDSNSEETQAVLNHLIRNSIIVPYPIYGKIVYDLPEGYSYPTIEKMMRTDHDVYVSFFEKNLKQYFFHENLDSIPEEETTPDAFFWSNPWFPRGDAKTLYSFVSMLEPRTFLEVGVGNSTKIARKAIQDFGLSTRIKSIDPAPRADVSAFSDEVIKESVTDADLKTFEDLRSGDILFIDGSHVCHAGTDVPFFFLNVFPILPKGIVVHIHDIFLPWEYGEAMLLRGFNEQHMLAAMIGNTQTWEILFPVHYASRTGIITGAGGGSFWIRKTS
jgi:hypothetical protein